jgi:hypothetical protein
MDIPVNIIQLTCWLKVSGFGGQEKYKLKDM